MKNKHRIALLLVVLLILPMCLSGCGLFGITSLEKQALDYLHEKYEGDTFTYEGSYGGGRTWANLEFSSQKYQGYIVVVHWYKNDLGQEIFNDNYIRVKYYEQEAELMTEIMDELFPTVEYFLDNEYIDKSGLPNTTDETTFEEYLADPQSDVGFVVYVEDSYELDKVSFEKQLEEVLVEKKICCSWGRVYFDDGSGYWEEVKDVRDRARYEAAERYSIRFEFEMDSLEGFSETEWIGKGFGVKSVCEGANAYLDGRYNDTFSYVEGSYNDTTENANIRMVSEQYPNTEVSVHYYKDENGQESYTDNYIAVKYQQQKEELLSAAMQEVFPEQEYVLISEIGDYDAVNATGETTFEEYMADPQSQITFILVMNEAYDIANREELENTLEVIFAEKGICCSRGRILFDDGGMAFDMLQSGEMTVDGYMRSNGYTNMLEFHMESPESISEYEWEVRDGKS